MPSRFGRHTQYGSFGALALTLLCLVGLGLLSPGHAAGQLSGENLFLYLKPAQTGAWTVVEGGAFGEPKVITLGASSNLVSWKTIGVLHGRYFSFSDPASPNFGQRFYRASFAPLTETNDWKNQVGYPYDPFRRFDTGPQGWVKFVILTNDPTRVYYGDARRYSFHYDFATARVEPLLGISLPDFERISFYNATREVVVGTVLSPWYPRTEYGIQFVSRDALPPELIRQMFELVRSTIVLDPYGEPNVRAFYIPTFEQVGAAQANAAYFASNGIPVSSVDRWINGDVCYSRGWAVGVLKFFSATNVPAAYASGDLLPQDILITDGIPAELPFVSGIITLSPTTANSHVAILAQSYGVPFAYMVDATARNRALQWVNREVAFQAGSVSYDGSCGVLLQPMEPALEPTTAAALAALRTGPAFQVKPRERFGSYTAPIEPRVPSEIRFFGGKAANYGLLQRVIPSNSLPALAISLDLWEDFMSQTLTNGNTLGQEISNRLAGFTYPPQVAALQQQLAGIRTLIRNSTQFTLVQQQAITNALKIFDRQRKIRFRSSTNVEDAESFTGAGLYDSYSGCLADDQDDDSAGPSACDPNEPEERGVFRAIRRVFASFYNDNAYLERLRLGVKESEVGMAILVHHSTPDEFEMANGVATGTLFLPSQSFEGVMVSQLGATSVANPDGSAVPEEVSLVAYTNRPADLQVRQNSSLVRLGETVMTWNADYRALADLLGKVARGFGAMLSNQQSVRLDLEYKKVSPGVLELKQVREVPTETNRLIRPFVINAPETVFANWQGYYDDIFLAHRLKSRWTLKHRNVQFALTNLQEGFYTDLSIEYLNGTNVQKLAGPVSSFAGFVHQAFNHPSTHEDVVQARWTMPHVTGPMDFTLRTFFNSEVFSQAPFRTVPESLFIGLELDVTFTQPVLNIGYGSQSEYATNASTRLYPLRAEGSRDHYREKQYNVVGSQTNVQIRSSYWLPGEAGGDDCRCPILRIVESRIEGFTTEPLALRGYWSQTIGDVHSQAHAEFLFEPRLESGLSVQQLNELAAADIMQIYLNENGSAFSPRLILIGFDGTPRVFSAGD